MTETKRRNHPCGREGQAVCGVRPPVPGPGPLRCGIRPACSPCGIGAHGFLCHFPDGSCLRFPNAPMEDVHHDKNL